jgi:integrase
MRQGEIFALTWDDVDLDARTIAIKSTLAEDRDGHLVLSEPKTAKSRRVIYLPELAKTALTALRAEGNSASSFVFTSAAGTPLRKTNFLRRAFKPLLKQAELPDVTFRSLRHTANSLLIEAGEDPLAIAGSLGHRTPVWCSSDTATCSTIRPRASPKLRTGSSPCSNRIVVRLS